MFHRSPSLCLTRALLSESSSGWAVFYNNRLLGMGPAGFDRVPLKSSGPKPGLSQQLGRHPLSFTPQPPLPRGSLSIFRVPPHPNSDALPRAYSGQWGGRDKQWRHNKPVFLSLGGFIRNKARSLLSREKLLQLRDLGHHEARVSGQQRRVCRKEKRYTKETGVFQNNLRGHCDDRLILLTSKWPKE